MGVTKSIDGGGLNTFADAYKKAGVYKVTDVQLPNLEQVNNTFDTKSYFDASPKLLSIDDVLKIKKGLNMGVITTIDSGHGRDYNSKLLVEGSATGSATAEKEPIEDKFRVISDKKVKLFYNK